MADYKISIGAELRTNEITAQLEKYNGNVKVGATFDKSGIDKEINSYTPSKVIEIKSKLIPDGITEVINKHQNSVINFKSDLDSSGIRTELSKFTKTDNPNKIRVKAAFTKDGSINKLITDYNARTNKPQVEFDAKLKEKAIEDAIWRYRPTTPVPVDLQITPDFTGFDTKVTNHKVTDASVAVPVRISHEEITKQINGYNAILQRTPQLAQIELKVKLVDDGINTAIRDYESDAKVPVRLEIKDDIDGLNGDIASKLKRYVEKPPEIPVKLKPATQGFKDAITRTPIPIQAELSDEALANINTKISGYTPTNKMPVEIKLANPKDINSQVTKLGSPTEPISVNVDLNESSINREIALFKPTATLGVEPDLMLENVDEQIKTYVPKVPLKVNVLADNDDIDEKTGRGKVQEAIKVNVKFDPKDINARIKEFKPASKMNVGVRLDFKTHKDKDKKIIQKGVAQQVKEFETKTKIKVGVELDPSDINQNVQNIEATTPIRLGVELNKSDIQKVINQIDDLRQRLEDIGSVIINVGNVVANNSVAGSGSIQQATQQVQNIISTSAKSAIRSISSKDIARFFKVRDIDSGVFENEMNNLVKKWTKNKGNVVDIQIETRTRFDENEQQNIEELSKAHVTYKNSVNESIRKTLEWQQIGTEDDGETPIMGWVEGHATYRSSIEKTKAQTDKFIKQQKKAVVDFTNQIEQINRAATDQNASRPIKDKSHLDALKAQYKEITSAINAMGSASRDTFDDEQNRVKKLISEYKSMKSEFRNAENVANKLSGTDYQSGRQIAEQNLAELKTKAKDYAAMSKTLDDLDESFKKVGDASSLKKFNNELKVAKAELAKVKAEAHAVELGKKLSGKVSGLTSKIDDLKKANNDIVNFKTKIDNVDVSIESLLNDLSQVKTKADFDAVSDKFNRFKEAAKNAGVALNNVVVNAKTVKDIKNKLKDVGFDGFTQEAARAHAEVEKLDSSSVELQLALERLDNAFNAVQTADEANDMKALTAANEEYEESLKRVYSLITLHKNNNKAEFDDDILELDKENALLRLENIFEDGSQAAKKYGDRVRELREEINKCANEGDMKKINKQVSNLEKDVKKSNLQTKTFGTKIKEQFSRYKDYLSISSVFMYAEQALRSMFEQVKLIDSAMTELKKVTDETDASYDRFLKNAATRSRELGTTLDGLISSTADFARLGYDFEDAQGLAEVANVYAVVGDDIESVDDATQSLISTLAAFKSEMNGMSNSDFAMDIVDKMNEVSNNFAISSGGLGDALQRSASSMAAANNTLDETIALITAANTVAQNPEKVGNAFKTMSMRIRGAKTELEEAGESTDGMAESTASLRQEMLALSGVDIMLNENTFKSTYQIMDELSEKWEDLSDIAQATIIELVAGKHQGNVFSSLMANFDTAREALDTSLNSSGSAMAEHAKWSESLEARLNKLKAAWQGLSQAFLKSDFLKAALDAIIALIDGVTKLMDTFGVLPTLLSLFTIGKGGLGVIKLRNDIKSLGSALEVLGKTFPFVSNGVSKLSSVLGGLSSSGGKAKGVLTALLGALKSHPYIAAAAIAVGILTAAFNHQKKKAEELSKEVDELTSKYKEQHNELSKLRNDYDTSKESSMISKYGELSKGVDGLNRNISLTTDEYAEYQSIVNKIAEQIPSLVSGYDEQGNALLSCKGNVEELRKEYEKLIHTQNQKILTKAGKIEDDFENVVRNEEYNTKGFFGWEWTKKANLGGARLSSEAVKIYEDVLKAEDSISALKRAISADEYGSETFLEGLDLEALSDLLEDAGFEKEGNWLDGESSRAHVERAFKENKGAIQNILDKYYADLEVEIESKKAVAQAKLSEAFDVSNAISGLDYGGISEELQSIAEQTVNSLDYTFFSSLSTSGKTVEEWTTELLNQLNSISNEDNAKIDAAFDLQTKFNGGEVSLGEYVSSLNNVQNTIAGLNLQDEAKKQLEISLGLNENGIVAQYDALIERLTDKDNYDFNIGEEDAKSLLDGLSSEELEVAVDVITEMSNNNVKETASDIKAAIEKELIIRGLTLNIDIEVEKGKLESLSTAIGESLSGSGLSKESINAVSGMFKELSSYEPAKLFERTANGIRLNSDELRKLSSEYKKTNIAKINKQLGSLGDVYNQTRKELYNLTYGTEEYKQKARDLSAIEEQINKFEELSATIGGAYSSYQEWQMAESAGSQRDMYENVISGLKNIDDEIKRGWYDDGTIEFLELLTGKDLSTAGIDKQKEAYKSLGEQIEHTSYKVRDFFTVDDDGNSTNRGVYNFLDAIGQMEEEMFGGKDVVKRDKNGVPIAFDFNLVGGDEVIAEALGISEELVQIMVRAADDAGFVVTLDGTYQQLDTLREKAQLASIELNKILNAGGKDTFNFNFNATSAEDITNQLGEANKILDNFRKTDGTIDLEVDGAEEALTVVSTLQSMLDRLNRPTYMNIQSSQVDKEIKKPLENLQELCRLTEQEHQLNITGADKTSLDEAKNEIYDYFENLDTEIKAELGLVDEKGNPLTGDALKNKLNSGEIEIPAVVDIQLEMDEKLGILVDKALVDAGLMKREQFEKNVDIYLNGGNVDNSDVKDEVEQAVDEIAGETSSETVEKPVDVAVTVDKVETPTLNFSSIFNSSTSAAAGESGMTVPVNVTAEPESVDTTQINTAVSNAEIEPVSVDIDATIDDTTVQEYIATEKNAEGKVTWDNITDEVDAFKEQIHEATGRVKWDDDVSKLQKHFTATGTVTWTSGNNVQVTVIQSGQANGTANSNGNALNGGTAQSGKAFAKGDWGIKGNGVALGGELGQELVVRDGKFFTIGDKGAEFFQYKKNDIIFNASQTASLFKYGGIKGADPRGKVFASGTAFSSGSGGAGAVSGNSVNSVTGGSYGGSGDDSSEEFEETIDWIEKAIDRIERAIGQLDTKANSIYRTWSERNKNLADQISKVQDEIDLQQKAYDKYIAAAEGVGLSSDYAKKIREGKIDIETITDEELKEKIDDYIQWYEKALDCKDAILELKETESELYQQRFENVSSQYDGILGVIEHEKNMLEEYINQFETQSWLVSAKYYDALAENERENLAELENQKANMIAEFNAAMDSGTIAEGSEAYYDMVNSIDEVTLAITESQTALFEYSQSIQQLKWEQFDLLQDKISSITEETEFLIELMSGDKLFDDNGQLTKEGKSTMGLHGVAYNTYMHQADAAAEEANRLKVELSKDPYDTELEERYREMIALQQEYILAAEDEKEAIKDLVSEGIELELDALQERIDKYEEALDSQKDLYDFQRKVKEQTEEIASLEKQMAAYSGDDSEEARQKVQQIKVELEKAKADLEDTQYDKYIDDSSALLDNLYLEYETTLNTRLDNVDALISDMITEINSDALIIGDTIREATESVGYTISNSMQTIWDDNLTGAKNVITTYGDKFVTAQTTTNTALNMINISLQNMIDKLNKTAETNTKSASVSSVSKSSSNTNKTKKTTTKKSSGDGTPKVGDKVKFVSGQYYYDSQGKNPVGSKKQGEYVYITKINKESWATHPYHISIGNKLGENDLGWLKLSQISGYATGAKKILSDEFAWTQENGTELIVRPSDGAILTPVSRNDKIFNANASNNLWDMANSPTEFIKDNLNLGSANAPNNSNSQNSYTQHLDKVVFNLPNVKNYEELLSAMQKDKNFERLILSMSIDRLAGKSSLAKGKAIR